MKADKSTDNLCDSCALCFADCPSENVVFGNGIGDDNVIECDSFIQASKLVKTPCESCIHKDEMGTLQPCMQCIHSDELYDNYECGGSD